jgi:hypothetical protein
VKKIGWMSLFDDRLRETAPDFDGGAREVEPTPEPLPAPEVSSEPREVGWSEARTLDANSAAALLGVEPKDDD